MTIKQKKLINISNKILKMDLIISKIKQKGLFSDKEENLLKRCSQIKEQLIEVQIDILYEREQT